MQGNLSLLLYALFPVKTGVPGPIPNAELGRSNIWMQILRSKPEVDIDDMSTLISQVGAIVTDILRFEVTVGSAAAAEAGDNVEVVAAEAIFATRLLQLKSLRSCANSKDSDELSNDDEEELLDELDSDFVVIFMLWIYVDMDIKFTVFKTYFQFNDRLPIKYNLLSGLFQKSRVAGAGQNYYNPFLFQHKISEKNIE